MHLSVSAFVFLFYLAIRFVQGDMNYDIIVPEFICEQNSGLWASKKGTTTIELVGDVDIDFFKVNFKQIGHPCRNTQRCNLIAWKAIRLFEKYLNDYPQKETKSIEFNNTMLVPGLEYILTVFVKRGDERDQKEVALSFMDDKLIKSSPKPLVSVKLVGVSSTEAHITYILHAEINICSDINFYFRWELLDEWNNLIKTFPDRSSELVIPSFTFQAEKMYNIKCCLTNLDNNEIIAEDIHSIDVKHGKESLVVKLPMVYTTVKVQQVINISPYIKDLANQDDNIKKIWSCVYNSEDFCKNNSDDELYIENGFLTEGDYNISLTVTKDSEVKSASALIKVLKDVPSIEIDTIETPVLLFSGIKITAKVDDLRTLCTVQWKSEEPYVIDLNSVPGNVNEIQHVVTARDLILRELEEFSSDTVNREYTLVIPPPSGDWQGLPNPGEDYKLQFLLEVTCPKIQLEDVDIEIEITDDILDDKIVTSALIEIDVVVPPQIQRLEVTPESGTALETIFTFECEEGSKTGMTHPFWYKFGYILDGREFVFSNQLGFTRAETVLPYDSVMTFVEVCEDLDSCDRVFGPEINISFPIDVKEENLLKIFTQILDTEDFYKAFNYALSILTVTRKTKRHYDYFYDGILAKIRYLLDTYDSDENWSKRVNKLINTIKEFREDFSFPEDILNGLVELRNKLLEAQREQMLSMVFHRNLLTTTKRKLNFENFKSYVEVSELIITSSSDEERVESEKEILGQTINRYLGELCTTLYEKQQPVSLESQIVILVVEKLPRKSYRNSHIIPFDENSWNTAAEVKLDAEAIEKNGKDKLCIAKMLFKDYFNKPGISYGTTVLDSEGESLNIEYVQVNLPVDISKINGSVPKCIVYNDGWKYDCTSAKLLSTFAQCSCSTTGAYYLEYEKQLATVSTESTKAETVTESKSITDIVLESHLTSTEFTKLDEVTQDSRFDDQSTTYISNSIDETTKTEEGNSITTINRDIEITTKQFKETTIDILPKGTIDSITTVTLQETLNHVTDISTALYTGEKDTEEPAYNIPESSSQTLSPDFSISTVDDSKDTLPNKQFSTVAPVDSTEGTSISEADILIISNSREVTTEINNKVTPPDSPDSTNDYSLDFATELTTVSSEVTGQNRDPKIDPGVNGMSLDTITITNTEFPLNENTVGDTEGQSTISEAVREITTIPANDLQTGFNDKIDTDSPVSENTLQSRTEGSSTVNEAINKVTTIPTDDVEIKKVSTEKTKTEVQFVTSPATVLVKTTEKSNKRVDTTFGTVFQGGINANFHANLSFKFSINTTWGR